MIKFSDPISSMSDFQLKRKKLVSQHSLTDVPKFWIHLMDSPLYTFIWNRMYVSIYVMNFQTVGNKIGYNRIIILLFTIFKCNFWSIWNCLCFYLSMSKMTGLKKIIFYCSVNELQNLKHFHALIDFKYWFQDSLLFINIWTFHCHFLFLLFLYTEYNKKKT